MQANQRVYRLGAQSADCYRPTAADAMRDLLAKHRKRGILATNRPESGERRLKGWPCGSATGPRPQQSCHQGYALSINTPGQVAADFWRRGRHHAGNHRRSEQCARVCNCFV
jgi:hypothetical protein